MNTTNTTPVAPNGGDKFNFISILKQAFETAKAHVTDIAVVSIAPVILIKVIGALLVGGYTAQLMFTITNGGELSLFQGILGLLVVIAYFALVIFVYFFALVATFKLLVDIEGGSGDFNKAVDYTKAKFGRFFKLAIDMFFYVNGHISVAMLVAAIVLLVLAPGLAMIALLFLLGFIAVVIMNIKKMISTVYSYAEAIKDENIDSKTAMERSTAILNGKFKEYLINMILISLLGGLVENILITLSGYWIWTSLVGALITGFTMVFSYELYKRLKA